MFSKLLPVQPDPGYESQTYVLCIAARITRPGARVIDIWIKLALKFVSLERKRVGWTKKILLSHEKLEKRPKIFFPDEILSRHSLQIMTAECLRKHKCFSFAKIWRPLRQDIGFFEDCRKFLTNCKRRVKLGVALISRFFWQIFHSKQTKKVQVRSGPYPSNQLVPE